MSKSSFFYHMKQLKKRDKYSIEKKMIVDIFHRNIGRYGYRRITLELKNRGVILNHKTVYKLMNETGLKCNVRMKKYRSYKGEIGRIAPNVLERNFETNKPNQKWATDVTEFSLFEKKVIFPLLLIYIIVRLYLITLPIDQLLI